MHRLLPAGFTYVGQIHGRPSPANDIVSDVYFNKTHMRIHFPGSCSLAKAPAYEHRRLPAVLSYATQVAAMEWVVRHQKEQEAAWR